MKKPRIIFSVLLVIFLVNLICAPFVYADGFMMSKEQGLKAANEQQQIAAINYENGIQNMLLEVDLNNLNGVKAAWLFPIPAKPDKISLDIVKAMPRWEGETFKSSLTRQFLSTFAAMSLSQIYGLVFWSAYIFVAGSTGNIALNESEVSVYEHMEKFGLTTELITAESGDKFYEYLLNQGLNLTPEIKDILNAYIGQDYSFAVSWISDVNKFKAEQDSLRTSWSERGKYIISVFTSFPTNKIYFPLIPTSVYNDQQIPIEIQLVGHVSPKLYPEIKKDSTVNYYVDDSYEITDQLTSFFNGKTGHIDTFLSTIIKIDTPAKNFVEDLWIKNSSPSLALVSGSFIYKNPYLFLIILFILISCLASLLSGLIVFRTEKPSKIKLFLFGLWNFLTIIGFVLATRRIKINGISLKKLNFSIYFSLIFTGLLIVMAILTIFIYSLI